MKLPRIRKCALPSTRQFPCQMVRLHIGLNGDISMIPSQIEVEAQFSQRNIHSVLHRSISYHFDRKLDTWMLRAYMQINEYLNKDYMTALGKPFTSKNNRIQALREHIETNSLDDILIAVFAACIRSKKDQTIQCVVGYLQSYLPGDDHFTRARTAGELIAICSGEGRLFSIERPVSDEAPMVCCNNWTAINEMFHTEFEFIEDTFYNPPLVEQIEPITNNRNCGYYTFDEPVILGRHTQHHDNLNYEALNALNSIPWVIDQEVMQQQELPSRPLKTAQSTSNFIDHVSTAQRVYAMLVDRAFAMAWQYCSRGRMYSHGHHVNLQGYEFKKAMLSFNHYEVATV